MCKKILSVIFAVIIAATCIPFASAAVRGDVDGNGKVNSSDALTVLQYSVGQIKTISKTKADVNGDGEINSSDALMILQISVGMIGATLRFGTGGEAGAYYGLGSALAQHVTNNTGTKVTVLTSDGSEDNINELKNGNFDIAFCQSDIMSYAYNGINNFERNRGFSTVAAIYEQQVQIITTNSKIKTVADLKGKTVSIGGFESTTYYNTIDILEAYGMTIKDIKPVYQGFGDSVEGIESGYIDASVIVSNCPTTAVIDLSEYKDIKLVEIDNTHANILIKKHPYYYKSTIKANMYNGVPATQTISIGSVIIARNDVPEQAIYNFVKDIYENKAELINIHSMAKEIDLKYGSSVSGVPYHPGAAKYFEEKGYKVSNVI